MAGLMIPTQLLLARAAVVLSFVPGAALGRFRVDGPSLCLTGH